jgi:16S rRNA (guanine(966)-N(2))-methyltransferase RsmD
MIRILAGEKRGMQLRVARTAAVRPTAANARQVLFDILGPSVAGTRWLDLYAGSGAVGLEALSRGAAECVLVESSHRCVEVIRDNIARLGCEGRCRLLNVPVEKALKRLATDGRPFDMIFLGPPYEGDEAKRCLLALGNLAPTLLTHSSQSLVIAQLSVHSEIPRTYGTLALERERRFGDTCLCFFRAAFEPPPEAMPPGE